MVNKVLLRLVLLLALVSLAFILLFVGQSPPPPEDKSKTILEMEMIPVDNSPGEYILEYSNGKREILKKDGSRSPLPNKEKK